MSHFLEVCQLTEALSVCVRPLEDFKQGNPLLRSGSPGLPGSPGSILPLANLAQQKLSSSLTDRSGTPKPDRRKGDEGTMES